MKGRPFWSRDRVGEVVAILREHENVTEACAAIAARFQRPFTPSLLAVLLPRYGFASYGEHLKAAKHDPVERRKQEDRTERLRREHAEMVERVREYESRQAFLDRISAVHEPPKILRREKKSGVREMTAVVLASDWHVEEPVDPVAVNGRNEYNLKIADARIKRFVDAVVWTVEHHRASGRVAIRDLILWLGGDLMSGYIHDELVETAQLSPTETVSWLIPRLDSVIATLLERLQLDSLVVPCSHGNHGRVGEKKVSTAAQNSFEHLLYCMLATRWTHEKRVQFEITKSAHQFVSAFDFVLHFHHGDSLRYSGGVGGLGIPLLKAVASWDEVRHAHYHHVGHWHTARDYGRALTNGSLIGYGPYSYWIKAAFEPPQQLAYLLDSRRGKTMVEPLWVGENAR